MFKILNLYQLQFSLPKWIILKFVTMWHTGTERYYKGRLDALLIPEEIPNSIPSKSLSFRHI